MPERNNFEELPANSVVDEVPYPAKMKPANDFGSLDFDLRANAWLIHQQSQGRLKVFANGTRRGRSVFCPPLRGFLDLPLRARLDPNDERQDQPKR